MGKRELESNIRKLYFIRAIRNFMLFAPIIVLFCQKNGMNMRDVFVLQCSFSLVLVLFEIPSGYFSDVFGRRVSITFGVILSSGGFVVYSLARNFGEFMSAEIILAVGMSFVSGCDSALLYDTLLALKKGFYYQKIEGRINSVMMSSEAVASILGGLLALISLRLPLYIDAIISLLAIPVAFSLIEPERENIFDRKDILKNMCKLVRYSIHDHTEIKWLIVFSAVTGASTMNMVWFIQPYFQHMGVSLGLFGLVWAAFQLIAAFFSWHADAIEKSIGRKRSLLLIFFLPVISYFLVSLCWCLSAGLLIISFYVSRGMNRPIISNYLNRIISSEKRATILSVRSLMERLFFVMTGPFIGWFSDVFSMRSALDFSGIIFLVFGLISLVFLHRHKAL